MKVSHGIPSDVAFTPAVKDVQVRLGSRAAYARMEASGQPYIQHRGGAPGFLKVLAPKRLGFADLRGNRQYISVGNLSENAQAHLFLIDYEERTRVKIWGEARVIEDDPVLLASLFDKDTGVKAERAILIDVVAWDANCPQHIPQRFEAEDVARALATRDTKIAALEAELAALRRGSGEAEG